MSVKIGPYTMSSNILLAPMAGVTDRPFRMLCRRFGAGSNDSWPRGDSTSIEKAICLKDS